jgi:hypothetical protein
MRIVLAAAMAVSVLLAAAPTLAAPAAKKATPTKAAAAPNIAAAKAYVDQIYLQIPGAFNWRTVRYTPELRRLIDKEQAEAKGEIGLIDAVPFCECQDTAGSYGYSTTVGPAGANRALVTVALRNGDRSTFRISMQWIGGRWVVADIGSARQPSLLAFLRKAYPAAGTAAKPTPVVQRPAGLPASIVYRGTAVKISNRENIPVIFVLDNVNGQISGVFDDTSIASVMKPAVSGVYQSGQCTLKARDRTYAGPCDSKGFSGTIVDKKGATIMTFSLAGSPPSYSPQQAMTATPSAAPADNSRYRAPPPQTSGAGSGFFDYVEGDPIDRRGGGGGDQYGGGSREPQGSRWTYGRARWVLLPGDSCRPEERLTKKHCYGDVIGYLRANPKIKDVTVITLDRPPRIGEYISNDTRVGYDYVQVKRRGEGFIGDKDRTGTHKAPMPPGCDYTPLKEGFIFDGLGPKGLREAALWRCP